ncbi:MAG: cation:proton antiporter [Tropicimonas sp.]|uniref:cation:proton antiporter domain-containing protein n=1 Tax=Tropicimonas sp. TaxID=2067044 RepID=UPI003A895D2D
METYYLLIAVAMLAYCHFSAWLAAAGITMPMLFLSLGLGVGLQGLVLDHETASAFYDLAELTLALLLFADATQLRRRALTRIGARVLRMLLIGLPLAIVLGAVFNLLLLPGWSLWEACLLAALLAPTDAALGQAILTNNRIPRAFRDAINAESGLNDGLALPFVIFFAGLAAGQVSGGAGAEIALGDLLASQIGLGVVAGIACGLGAGRLRTRALARGLMDPELGMVATLVLVALAYFGADVIGGNAFVAVYVAGLAYANSGAGEVHQAREFLDHDGRFLAMLSFFFIGALFVPQALEHASLAGILVVLLSLLVVRPLAIWLALSGTATPPRERLFYGWFGPRGLATSLFAVFVVMDFEGVARAGDLLVISITAVLVSAFAHGISAKYAVTLFGLEGGGPGNGAG